MKGRSGFVSNSSSSSFVVYGTSFDSDEFMELIQNSGILEGKYTKEEIEAAREDGDTYEILEETADKVGLEVHNDYDSGTVYVGISPFDIKDDETGEQFKARIKESIEKLVGQEIKLEPISETFYN